MYPFVSLHVYVCVYAKNIVNSTRIRVRHCACSQIFTIFVEPTTKYINITINIHTMLFRLKYSWSFYISAKSQNLIQEICHRSIQHSKVLPNGMRCYAGSHTCLRRHREAVRWMPERWFSCGKSVCVCVCVCVWVMVLRWNPIAIISPWAWTSTSVTRFFLQPRKQNSSFLWH